MEKRRWLEALPSDLDGPLRLTVQGRSMWPTLQPGDEIIVEPISRDAIQRGDWIVLRAYNGLLVHRMLGFTKDGDLLTKGDGHRAPDPPWPLDAIVGRVCAVNRNGNMSPRNSHTLSEKVKTLWHWAVAKAWKWLKRVGLLMIGLLLLPVMISASVDLIEGSFKAEVKDNRVYFSWETGSEADMLGFYLQRSEQEYVGYQRIPNSNPDSDDLIPAKDPFGASYVEEFIDADVEPETRYYYQLEAVDINGDSELHGPISVCVDCAVTPTPTSTPTSTPPPPDEPTPIPPLYVRFWSDATSLQAGDCTVLRWQTDNAARITLNGEGVPGPYSERQVCPCSDTDYVLGVSGQDGSYEEQAISLAVSGQCSVQQVRRTATPTPTSPPTRTPTPRPLVADGESDSPTPAPTASSTPSPATDRDPTATPTSPRPGESTSPLAPPSPTFTLAQPLDSLAPTRTPSAALTSPLSPEPRESIAGFNWTLPLLGLGGLFIALGGWGIWRAWKTQS